MVMVMIVTAATSVVMVAAAMVMMVFLMVVMAACAALMVVIMMMMTVVMVLLRSLRIFSFFDIVNVNIKHPTAKRITKTTTTMLNAVNFKTSFLEIYFDDL